MAMLIAGLIAGSILAANSIADGRAIDNSRDSPSRFASEVTMAMSSRPREAALWNNSRFIASAGMMTLSTVLR
jgi:hypothetical protein